jgi:hypothetical protein
MTTGRINQVARDERKERRRKANHQPHARHSTRDRDDEYGRKNPRALATRPSETRRRCLRPASSTRLAGATGEAETTTPLRTRACAGREDRRTHQRTLAAHPRSAVSPHEARVQRQRGRRIERPLLREFTNARSRKRIATTHGSRPCRRPRDAEAPPQNRRCDRRIRSAHRGREPRRHTQHDATRGSAAHRKNRCPEGNRTVLPQSRVSNPRPNETGRAATLFNLQARGTPHGHTTRNRAATWHGRHWQAARAQTALSIVAAADRTGVQWRSACEEGAARPLRPNLSANSSSASPRQLRRARYFSLK